ncbi:radical SAM protein [Hyperthermus butylicus]|uniref:Biotin synthase-related enzyme n=1 Tax=Hyperthermus butylicus (strain DSM 5456 / JCM 9403 / PLM1-5) TaxID=415426 RepID=A2BK58_HYPBU|nr:radical SAM protein [Hyperthermus butylicus]ABM80369.1 Biotin synthase-related enzyme [Hyperthermus butylicus DSM 5456]
MEEILVRASIGTLAALGLAGIRVAAKPTTAYLLQYSPYGCLAGCKFCTQSLRSPASKDMLSRVKWPVVRLTELLAAWRKAGRPFTRICIQTVVKPWFGCEAARILEAIRTIDQETPASIASTPVSTRLLLYWKSLGVDYLGVGLDAVTPTVFRRAGKPFTWTSYMDFIERGIAVYGRGHVYVHLIVGLGEKPTEIIRLMEKLYAMGARVALFNYTAVTSWKTSSVRIEDYRLLQLAREILEEGLDPWDYIEERNGSLVLRECPPVNLVKAVLTSGCPGCNRPFYNESPRGPIYNYPSPALAVRDREALKHQLLGRARGLERCIEGWVSQSSGS